MLTIPARLAHCEKTLPALGEAKKWQLLRKWTLSEVYRFTSASGETRIAKWGGADMAGKRRFTAS